MIDGGINDVDVRTILSPLTSFAALGDRTKLHCYFDMKQLLTAVVAKFPNPATKIVVTSYYPILSTDSDPLRIPHLLSVRGVPLPEFLDADPLIRKIVSLCLQFWHDSEMWLRRAITETNAAIGGNRVRFAVPQFAQKNSVFASEAWLWGLNLDLSPQDEVVATRGPACDVFYQGKPDELLACAQCHRASAGHPNVIGASQFADAIEQELA